MPILNDRLTDQLHELLPEYMNEEGQGFKKFLTAYFDFLEKGILIYEQTTDLELIGLEDGEGSLLQERGTFDPSLYLNQSSYTKETPIYKMSNRFMGNR